jgi:RNA polymerase sigma-70 factor (ECF subfamily)
MKASPVAVIKSLFTISDEQAMWRVQTHDDASAFAQLVKRWESPVRRLCTRITGDEHKAQDLTQEAFAKLFTHRKDYRPDGKFSTYLWRIALNLCYDELRRMRRRGESSLEGELGEMVSVLDTHPSPAPGPDKAALQQERGEIVRQALLRLPEPYRCVVVLRHYEDLKFREIAEVLDIPEGTVKSRMAEALTQLGKLLEPSLIEGSPKRPTHRLTRISSRPEERERLFV